MYKKFISILKYTSLNIKAILIEYIIFMCHSVYCLKYVSIKCSEKFRIIFMNFNILKTKYLKTQTNTLNIS